MSYHSVVKTLRSNDIVKQKRERRNRTSARQKKKILSKLNDEMVEEHKRDKPCNFKINCSVVMLKTIRNISCRPSILILFCRFSCIQFIHQVLYYLVVSWLWSSHPYSCNSKRSGSFSWTSRWHLQNSSDDHLARTTRDWCCKTDGHYNEVLNRMNNSHYSTTSQLWKQQHIINDPKDFPKKTSLIRLIQFFRLDNDNL